MARFLIDQPGEARWTLGRSVGHGTGSPDIGSYSRRRPSTNTAPVRRIAPVRRRRPGMPVITHGVFLGRRVCRHVLSWMAGGGDQAVMVASRVVKGVALVLRAAVATTVRTSASPLAAHIAR